jgi:hypothetical protein
LKEADLDILNPNKALNQSVLGMIHSNIEAHLIIIATLYSMLNPQSVKAGKNET